MPMSNDLIALQTSFKYFTMNKVCNLVFKMLRVIINQNSKPFVYILKSCSNYTSMLLPIQDS